MLDMTAYWAGPVASHVLALLGADVIHLESPKRPDGARLVGGVPQTDDQFWERGPIFAALNTNKKSLTVDLGTSGASSSLRRFIATCDVVIENYTPRVLEQLGLDYESLRADRPDLVMVRMPGFGLTGPGVIWRRSPSSSRTLPASPGSRDIPICSRSSPTASAIRMQACTPSSDFSSHSNTGADGRRRTRRGCDGRSRGQCRCRAGDRVLRVRRASLPCREQGPVRGPAESLSRRPGPTTSAVTIRWVAIAVATDEQWSSLCQAIGDPEWAADPALTTVSGRVREHDQIDAFLDGSGAATSRQTKSSRPVGSRRPCREGDAAAPPTRSPAARFPWLLRGCATPGGRDRRVQHAANAVLTRTGTTAHVGMHRCSANTR